MHSPTIRSHGIYIALVLIVGMLFGGSRLGAESAGGAPDPGDKENAAEAGRHVRTIDPKLDALIVEGAERSPLFRKLVHRLDHSTVIVYIESRLLTGSLGGRLTFVGGGQHWRYLRIEIECRQTRASQIAALGHELQHAVEIAHAAAAVDQTSIRALYGTIGFATDDSLRRFESDAAKRAGFRIRRELSLQLPTTSYDIR